MKISQYIGPFFFIVLLIGFMGYLAYNLGGLFDAISLMDKPWTVTTKEYPIKSFEFDEDEFIISYENASGKVDFDEFNRYETPFYLSSDPSVLREIRRERQGRYKANHFEEVDYELYLSEELIGDRLKVLLSKEKAVKQ